jgi:hypothetical protein
MLRYLFHYFRAHYPHFFPNLTDTEPCQAGCQPVASFGTSPTLSVEGCGQRTANWPVIDTLPVPMCLLTTI